MWSLTISRSAPASLWLRTRIFPASNELEMVRVIKPYSSEVEFARLIVRRCGLGKRGALMSALGGKLTLDLCPRQLVAPVVRVREFRCRNVVSEHIQYGSR